MAARRGAAAAAQHHLRAHELAVIFADRALGGPEAGIGKKGAPGPFPDVAEQAGRRPAARAGPGRPRRAGCRQRDRAAGRAPPIPPRSAAARRPSGRRRRPRNRRCGRPARRDRAAAGRRGRSAASRPRRRASRAAPRSRSACTQAQPSDSQSSGSRIAAVGDEAQPFAVGDRPVGERVRMEQDLVARPLAVEGEAGAVMADLDDAPRARRSSRSAPGSAAGGAAPARPDGRAQRVLGEGRDAGPSASVPDAAARG